MYNVPLSRINLLLSRVTGIGGGAYSVTRINGVLVRYLFVPTPMEFRRHQRMSGYNVPAHARGVR